MFFPIGDENLKNGYKPLATYAFIGFNFFMFIWQFFTPGNLICELATIPGDILSGKNYYTLLTSMFMHGSWMHLLGNLLFLWVFADNIEGRVGSMKFIVFYFFGGLAGSFAHIFFSQGLVDIDACCKICNVLNPCQEGDTPCVAYIPSLGASGAISAVMGAYLVMFPKSKVKVFVLFFFRSFWVPAFLFLILWFGMQVFSGVGSLNAASSQAQGVAWWAHIGGFVFGLLFGGLYRFWFHDWDRNEGNESISEDGFV